MHVCPLKVLGTHEVIVECLVHVCPLNVLGTHEVIVECLVHVCPLNVLGTHEVIVECLVHVCPLNILGTHEVIVECLVYVCPIKVPGPHGVKVKCQLVHDHVCPWTDLDVPAGTHGLGTWGELVLSALLSSVHVIFSRCHITSPYIRSHDLKML